MLRKFAKSASDALPDPLTTANHSPTFPYLQVLKSKLIITHPASIGCSLLPAIPHPLFAIRYALFAPCSLLFPRAADPEKVRVPFSPLMNAIFQRKRMSNITPDPLAPVQPSTKDLTPFPGVGKSGDDGQLANVHNFP